MIFVATLRVMNNKSAFANKIKALRKMRGLTQFELAEAIERSTETISQIERGKFFPGFETVRLLSEALHVPIEDLFGEPAKGESPKTSRMLSELYAVATTLDDEHLEIALAQIKAFNMHKQK